VPRAEQGDKECVSLLATLARTVTDYALPPRCAGCGDIVDCDHRFCARCWVQLDFLTADGCALCSIPLGIHDGLTCGKCLADPPAHDGVRAAVAYGDIASRVVLSMKYGRRPGVAKTIAALLAPRLPTVTDALLIPVPLHRWRLWSRGFNQSQAIATALGKRTGLVCDPDILIRTRATPPMRGMNPSERRRSVRSAFAVRAAYLPDRRCFHQRRDHK